jgi:hypothetical protein
VVALRTVEVQKEKRGSKKFFFAAYIPNFSMPKISWSTKYFRT